MISEPSGFITDVIPSAPWGTFRAEPGTRVLMTSDVVGGVWNYTLELTGWLVNHGIDVLVATMGPLPRPEQVASIRERGAQIATSTYRLEWMEKPWDDVSRAGEWLLELESDFRPDVIHLNGYAHATLPFDASVVLASHSSLGTWWRAVHGEDVPPDYLRYVATVRSSIAAADHVVAPTKAMIDALLSCELRERYRTDLARTQQLWRKVSIVPNGSPLPPSREVTKEPFALSAGRIWDRAKNISLLERIARNLTWPIHVAGQVEFEGSRYVGGFANLHLLGELSPEALHDSMDRAAIYLAPALYEPFGLAPLEAAQRGCALVLADIPSFREIWGDAAAFVSPRDPQQWVATIQTLTLDDERRGQLSQAAARVARGLTTERMGMTYSHIYRMMLNQSQRTAAPIDVLT